MQAEALRLSGKDRARLAEGLLLSLDEASDDRAESLWLEEAQRRYRSYEEGKTKAKPAEPAFRAARAKGKGAKGKRATFSGPAA